MLLEIVYIVAAYLVGSISFAIIVCKLFGKQDPRYLGSGNPGATNVVRVGGWSAAIATFIGDTAKATIPVGIAVYLGITNEMVALIGLGAFLGHLFPLYHRFKGGKGVASYWGVLIATQPLVALAWAGGWLTLIAIFRHSSVGGITMCAVTPFMLWWHAAPYPLISVAIVMSVLVIVRHRQNIAKLIAGTEA